MASIFPDLAAPDNIDRIEVTEAINPDIRMVLEKQLPPAIKEAAPLVKHFKGATPLDTARNIWEYERDVIKYNKDSEDNQDIRMPRRFHHDKTGDCKTYSLNALAIYKAIYPNLPVAFKYTAYKPGATIPSHVYAVVQDKAGKQIIIDGCYTFFNAEKNYTLALPLKWDMNVRVLSGIEIPNDFNELYDKLSRPGQIRVRNALAAGTQIAQIKKQIAEGTITGIEAMEKICAIEQSLGAAKKSKKKLKYKAKDRALHWLDIATLAIGRGAYDALIALNFNGMADKLMILHDKYPDKWTKIATTYFDLGGYEKALLKAAKIGVKHAPFFLSKKAKERFEAKFGGDSRSLGLKMPKGFAGVLADIEMHGIGDPVTGATVASATPVLAVLIPVLGKIFKSLGQDNHATELQGQATDLVTATQPGGIIDVANVGIPTVTAADVPPGLPPLPPTPIDTTTNQPVTPDDDNSFVDEDDIWGSQGTSGIGNFWDDVGGALGGLFHKGMNALKNKLDSSSKASPLLKQLGNTAIDGAQMMAGNALKQLNAATTATSQYSTKLQPNPDAGNTKFHPAAKIFGMDATTVKAGAAGLALIGLTVALTSGRNGNR